MTPESASYVKGVPYLKEALGGVAQQAAPSSQPPHSRRVVLEVRGVGCELSWHGISSRSGLHGTEGRARRMRTRQDDLGGFPEIEVAEGIDGGYPVAGSEGGHSQRPSGHARNQNVLSFPASHRRAPTAGVPRPAK
jgi:hypothetical protein